jgi:hypothetical protein
MTPATRRRCRTISLGDPALRVGISGDLRPAAAIPIWAAKPVLEILTVEFRVRFAVEADGPPP